MSLSSALQKRADEREEAREAREAEGKPSLRGRLSLGLAIVVIVTVLGAAAVVFWPRNADPVTTPADAPAPPAQVGSGGGSGPSAFTVGFDQAAVVPSDLTWNLVRGMAVPSSQTAGPLLSSTQGISYGYARTPAGAVMAAAVFLAQLNTPGTDLSAIIGQRLENAPGKDTLVSAYAGFTQSGSQPRTPDYQLAAIRVVAYSDAFAAIEVVRSKQASAGPDGSSLVSDLYLLTWSDNDWKIVPPADGAGNVLRPLQGLDGGYVKFSGVS